MRLFCVQHILQSTLYTTIMLTTSLYVRCHDLTFGVVPIEVTREKDNKVRWFVNAEVAALNEFLNAIEIILSINSRGSYWKFVCKML